MFDIAPLLSALEGSRLGLFMQTSSWAFPTVESFHVVFLVLVVGVIAIVDLRLLGVASRSRRLTEVAADCLAWTWIAFVLAAVTGLMMFVANATTYWDNTYFRWKMVCLMLAGVNMLFFELFTMRGVAEWDHDSAAVPLAGRIAGLLSLAFWFGVIAFGRWIGFTPPDLPF